MSDKKFGFQNAPSVKEFKTGMRVKLSPHHRAHGGEWATVGWVDCGGWAYCDIDNDATAVVDPHLLPGCTLDLYSIWEGREYKNGAGEQCRILFVSDSHVIVIFDNFSSERGFTQGWQRSEFLAEWTPLPLSAEKPPEAHRPLSEIIAELKTMQRNPWFESRTKGSLDLVVEAFERIAEGGK